MMKSMVNHYSRVTNPTIYENGKLYFSDLTLNGFLNSVESMESFRPAIEVDLIENKVTLIEKIKVPDFYKEKTWQAYWGNFSRIKNDDLWIYSWKAMDSLLIFDENMNLLKSVNAKSEFAKPLNTSSGDQTVEVQFQESITQTSYTSILYDPYREVYYRFVLIGRALDDSYLEDQFPTLKNDFSIIVLDKDFNILTEKRFPSKIHYPYKSFVGKKGLYLSRTNPFYEDINEDEVVFDVYEFT
ncbi:DUF4221 family protein [Belliella baltica]|nr:DUF4221 family protein [Belliella baltica]